MNERIPEHINSRNSRLRIFFRRASIREISANHEVHNWATNILAIVAATANNQKNAFHAVCVCLLRRIFAATFEPGYILRYTSAAWYTVQMTLRVMAIIVFIPFLVGLWDRIHRCSDSLNSTERGGSWIKNGSRPWTGRTAIWFSWPTTGAGGVRPRKWRHPCQRNRHSHVNK